MAVKTKTVQGRRKLRFSNYDEILAEARTLAGGQTRILGNWSLGQIFEHLSKAHDMALDGASSPPPLIFWLVGPFFKKGTLRNVARGFQLPRRASRLLPSETSTADGLVLLEKSVVRLKQTSE